MEKWDRRKVLELIFCFFEEISIPYTLTEINEKTFLPGVQIKDGILQIDLEKLKFPGDLLHEAGHIAVTNCGERSSLNDNVIEDKPEKAGEEMAVLLWSYAALKKIGLPAEIVFHEEGYNGDSKWLRDQFESGNYVGLPLLQWMGLTDATGEFEFPGMKTWLRD